MQLNPQSLAQFQCQFGFSLFSSSGFPLANTLCLLSALSIFSLLLFIFLLLLLCREKKHMPDKNKINAMKNRLSCTTVQLDSACACGSSYVCLEDVPTYRVRYSPNRRRGREREKEGRRVGTIGGVLRYAGTAVPPRCES